MTLPVEEILFWASELARTIEEAKEKAENAVEKE